MKENSSVSSYFTKFIFVPSVLSLLFSVLMFMMPTITLSHSTDMVTYSVYTLTKTDGTYSGTFSVFCTCLVICFAFAVIMTVSVMKKEKISPVYYLLHIASCITFNSIYFIFFCRFSTEQAEINKLINCNISIFGIIYAVFSISMITATAIMLIGRAKHLFAGVKND